MTDNTTLRFECWDNAVHSFGTGYIFEKKSFKVLIKMRILQFFGIGVPLSLGGIVIALGGNFSFMNYLLIFVGVIATLQLLGTLWSLIAKWDDLYAYSIESKMNNYRLADKFSFLAKSPPEDINQFKIQYEILKKDDEIRNNFDNKQNISEKEKRMGLRAALRQYQRECICCHKTPVSMRPSDCDVCGNF